MDNLYCFLCSKPLSTPKQWAKHKHTKCHQSLINAYIELIKLTTTKLGVENGTDADGAGERIRKFWGVPREKENTKCDKLAGYLSDADTVLSLLGCCEKEETFTDPGLRRFVTELIADIDDLSTKLIGA